LGEEGQRRTNGGKMQAKPGNADVLCSHLKEFSFNLKGIG
jgi:hypothetical protein